MKGNWPDEIQPLELGLSLEFKLLGRVGCKLSESLVFNIVKFICRLFSLFLSFWNLFFKFERPQTVDFKRKYYCYALIAYSRHSIVNQNHLVHDEQ